MGNIREIEHDHADFFFRSRAKSGKAVILCMFLYSGSVWNLIGIDSVMEKFGQVWIPH